MMTEERYLTVDDVARVLRKHPRTIRDWIVKGCVTERGLIHLDATKVGKSWLVHPEWLELFEHRIRPSRRADLDLE
ncbi:MAG: helix-turn-helix domain-containing protein [Rhodobacterales bacterium]